MPGIKSRAVSGSLEPSDALKALLQGTGISFQINGNTVTLVSGGGSGLQLGATTISGQALGMTTEDTGSYTTGATTTAIGLPLTIHETPQTVTVVTRQMMDDRGVQSVADALRNTPGVTTQKYDSDRTEFSARGFAITNFQYDGVNIPYDGVYGENPNNGDDAASLDHIEVVKGATGLMTGAGDPSATVNLIRKKPTKEFKASVSATAGSWDNYRTEGDISGSLTDSGNVRGRFVGAYQDKDSYMDHYSQKKDIYYGILEADLTDDTLLTFGVDKSSITPRGSSWTGNAPYFTDGSRTDFSRSFNPGADWSRRDFDSVTYFASLEQALANDWKFKASFDQKTTDHDTQLASASGGSADPVTGEGNSCTGVAGKVIAYRTPGTSTSPGRFPWAVASMNWWLVSWPPTRARRVRPTTPARLNWCRAASLTGKVTCQNRNSRKTANTSAPRARTDFTWPPACVRPTTCRLSSAAA